MEYELYLIEILHQTTTPDVMQIAPTKLYLIEILHQTTTLTRAFISAAVLYLIEILHQTTTTCPAQTRPLRCILSKFYIKPQLAASARSVCAVVSYRNSTSNHNISRDRTCVVAVVSYRNSTSNHNSMAVPVAAAGVVSYRNSTSNHNSLASGWWSPALYLIEILHQTTTRTCLTISSAWLYLIEILHQTTTLMVF